MKRRFLALILGIVIVLTLLPQTAFAKTARLRSVVVGTAVLTEETPYTEDGINASKQVFSDTYAYFDVKTGTLLLHSFAYSGEGHSDGDNICTAIYADGNLTIFPVGICRISLENNLSYNNIAIYVTGDLVITSDLSETGIGTLAINSGKALNVSVGIGTGGDISVTDKVSFFSLADDAPNISAGIVCSEVLTVADDAFVMALSSESELLSCGIYTSDLTATGNCILYALGGDATTEDNTGSYGINSLGSVNISGNATVEARSEDSADGSDSRAVGVSFEDAMSVSGNSYLFAGAFNSPKSVAGIHGDGALEVVGDAVVDAVCNNASATDYAAGIDVSEIRTGGTSSVNAAGGYSSVLSHGIYTEDADFQGKLVVATGGKGSEEAESYGIQCEESFNAANCIVVARAGLIGTNGTEENRYALYCDTENGITVNGETIHAAGYISAVNPDGSVNTSVYGKLTSPAVAARTINAVYTYELDAGGTTDRTSRATALALVPATYTDAVINTSKVALTLSTASDTVTASGLLLAISLCEDYNGEMTAGIDISSATDGISGNIIAVGGLSTGNSYGIYTRASDTDIEALTPDGGTTVIAVGDYQALNKDIAFDEVLMMSRGYYNDRISVLSDDTVPPMLYKDSCDDRDYGTATISFRSNEAGTYYYVVVGNFDQVPTEDEIMAGTQGKMIRGAHELYIDGIYDSEHDVYIISVDAAGNVSNTLVIHIPAFHVSPLIEVTDSGAADPEETGEEINPNTGVEIFSFLLWLF